MKSEYSKPSPVSKLIYRSTYTGCTDTRVGAIPHSRRNDTSKNSRDSWFNVDTRGFYTLGLLAKKGERRMKMRVATIPRVLPITMLLVGLSMTAAVIFLIPAELLISKILTFVGSVFSIVGFFLWQEQR